MFSFVCFCFFLNFSPKPTKTDDKEENAEREFKKSVNDERCFEDFFKPKPLFFTSKLSKSA